MIDLEVARARVGSLHSHRFDQIILDSHGLVHVLDRLEVVHLAILRELLGELGVHTAEDHVAGASSTIIFLVLEHFKCLHDTEEGTGAEFASVRPHIRQIQRLGLTIEVKVELVGLQVLLPVIPQQVDL